MTRKDYTVIAKALAKARPTLDSVLETDKEVQAKEATWERVKLELLDALEEKYENFNRFRFEQFLEQLKDETL